MKREFLEKLGLEKDTIDKIMAENGKDIEAEKDKTKAMTAERDTLQGNLDEANKTIENYKDMDIDAIKKSATNWEEKAKKANADLEAARKDAALDKALSGAGSIDTDLLKKVLDHEAIIYKDDKITGLTEQIDQLKKDKPYLFQAADKSGENGDRNKGGNGFEPYVPESNADGGESKTAMQQEINAILGI